MVQMAVNSSTFLSLLKELQCPQAANLEEKQLDWLFQNESCKQFIAWFCKNINKDNLLTDDQIERFQSGTGPVLRGKQLEQALSALRKKEVKVFYENQPSSIDQQFKAYEELSDHLDKEIADACEESRGLETMKKDMHNNFVSAERKLAEVEAKTEVAKAGLRKQMSMFQEFNKQDVAANSFSLNPLKDEMSKFDDQIRAFLKKCPSLDFESLLKATEENLSKEKMKDYAGTFDSEERRKNFLNDIKTSQQYILKKYYDQKIENARLKAEMARFEQLEKAHHDLSSNLSVSESSFRMDLDSEAEDLMATLKKKRKEIPEIDTAYGSRIMIRELHQELLVHSFAWEMCEKIEEWVRERLSISELIGFFLRQEGRAVEGLRHFLEDFLKFVTENDTPTTHSLDTQIFENEMRNGNVIVSPFCTDSKKLFEKVKDALDCVKKASELVKEDRSQETERGKLKSALREIVLEIHDVKTKQSANAQLFDGSRLQTFLDRELWLYFYTNPDRLSAMIEKWKK